MSETIFKHKVTSGLFWNQLRHFSLYPLMFLSSIILARGLEPALFGVYSGILAIIGTLFMFSSLGLEGLCLIELPKIYADDSKINYFTRNVVLIRIGASLLVSLIVLLLPGYVVKKIGISSSVELSIIVATGYFLVGNVSSILAAIYKGMNKFKNLCMIDVGSQSLNVFYCYIALTYTKNINVLIAGMLFIQIIVLFILATGLRKKLFSPVTPYIMKREKELSVNLYLTQYVQYAMSKQKDILIIGAFLFNPMLIAFYTIATKLVDAFDNLLTMGFGEVTQPAFSEAYTKNGINGLSKMWNIFIRVEIMLTIPTLLFAIYHAHDIVIMLYTVKYTPAVIILQIYAMFLFLSNGVMGGGTSQKVLYATDNQRLAFKIVCCVAILNILLSISLIIPFGIIGIVVATGVATVCWRLYELLNVMSILHCKYPYVFFAKVLVSAMTALISTMYIRADNIALVIVSAAIYTIVYAIFIILFKIYSRNEIDEFIILYPKLTIILSKCGYVGRTTQVSIDI